MTRVPARLMYTEPGKGGNQPPGFILNPTDYAKPIGPAPWQDRSPAWDVRKDIDAPPWQHTANPSDFTLITAMPDTLTPRRSLAHLPLRPRRPDGCRDLARVFSGVTAKPES